MSTTPVKTTDFGEVLDMASRDATIPHLFVTESVQALAGATQEVCSSSCSTLAVQFWLFKFGFSTLAVPMYLRVSWYLIGCI